MAKKNAFSGDRSDPKQNKSLAIRTVLKTMPKKAKASEVVAEVKKQFGHTVGVNRIYMIKTKHNIKTRTGSTRPTVAAESGMPSSAAQWVEAIRLAKKLLEATGSVADATSLLKAVDQ